MKNVLIILFVITIINGAFAQDFYNVKYVKNYDGDTITVNLRCSTPIFCQNIPIRIKNIDTPEIRTKSYCEKSLAFKAKNTVWSLLSNRILTLRNCHRGKYFRLVCVVEADYKNIGEYLLKHKLARYYNGKTKSKKKWCKD